MKTFAALITALAIALGVAACGNDEASAPEGPLPEGTTVLVSYNVKNGLSGADRTVTVKGDGSVHLVFDGAESDYELNPDELTEFQLAVRDAKFRSLEDTYEQTEDVSDASTIKLSSQGREVTILQPADPPEAVQRLIELFRDQLEQHGNDAQKDGPTQTDGRPYVPGPSDNLIAYERSGGVGGITERLFIRPDGAARVEVNGKAARFTLPDDELNDLRDLIDQADFQDLNTKYGPPNGTVVADGFNHGITADGRTVTVEELGEPPLPLQTLLQQVNTYIEPYR